MNIWVDADACPKAVKAVLFKAAERRQVALTLIANQYIPTPRSKVIRAIQVAQGFDEADKAIVERVCAGDPSPPPAGSPYSSSSVSEGRPRKN